MLWKPYRKALKNFAIFTRKHLCWGPSIKRDSNAGVFLLILKVFYRTARLAVFADHVIIEKKNWSWNLEVSTKPTPQWLPIARKKQPCSLGITLSSGVLTFFEIWLRTYWFYDVISPMLHLKTKVQYEIIRFCTSAPSFQNVFLKAKQTWNMTKFQSFQV